MSDTIVGRLIEANKMRESAVNDMFNRMAEHCEHHTNIDEGGNWPMRRCECPSGSNSGVCAIEICPLLQATRR